jgi:protein-S-isoprenylcysteine O-methyltransferase Ste14
MPDGHGPDIRINPALIALGFMLVAILLHQLHPLPFPDGWPVTGIGIGVISIAGTLALWSFVQYQRTDTGMRADEPASELITGGPYRYSRNPQYIVLALVQVTVACWLDNLWILLLTPLTLVVVDRYAVVREERYLEQRFGQEYLDYRHRVRRWL